MGVFHLKIDTQRTTLKYDMFISYSPKDLAKELKGEGLTIWLDLWEKKGNTLTDSNINHVLSLEKPSQVDFKGFTKREFQKLGE